jgi:hypothetical protein
VKESANKTARDLIRLGDLNAAARIVEAEFQTSSGGQRQSEDLWGMRLIQADLLRLRGHTDEALAFLLFGEDAFPPNACDLPTLIGLKKLAAIVSAYWGNMLSRMGYFARLSAWPRMRGCWNCYARFINARP